MFIVQRYLGTSCICSPMHDLMDLLVILYSDVFKSIFCLDWYLHSAERKRRVEEAQQNATPNGPRAESNGGPAVSCCI